MLILLVYRIKKILYDFAKEMYFDLKAKGDESIWEKTLIKLLKTPGLMISVSGISKTTFLPSDSNELFNWLNFLLGEKQAGIISNIIIEDIIARID